MQPEGGGLRSGEADLEKGGFQVLAKPCNVSRKEELQALVDATTAKWGGIDIVVANAAANPYYGPLTGISDEAFDKIMANNVKSVLWLAAMTLPAWPAARVGQLPGGGLDRRPDRQHRDRRLRHLQGRRHHLVRNLAAEWGPKNVRVNAIAPGLIKTEFARALWEGPEARRRARFNTPLRRLGEPRDIGGIAVFLASRGRIHHRTMHRRRRRRYHSLAMDLNYSARRAGVP